MLVGIVVYERAEQEALDMVEEVERAPEALDPAILLIMNPSSNKIHAILKADHSNSSHSWK